VFVNLCLQNFQHIRELYAAKERALANEDYDAAKSLRDAIEQLKEVGGRIAKLELRKKAAVQAEDYDTAKQIKAEIDRMRHSLGNAPPPQLQVLPFIISKFIARIKNDMPPGLTRRWQSHAWRRSYSPCESTTYKRSLRARSNELEALSASPITTSAATATSSATAATIQPSTAAAAKTLAARWRLTQQL
jgi:hypothetical protein